MILLFSSLQFSCSVMSDSLQPHEPQHTRPPCPSPTPGVHLNPQGKDLHLYICPEALLLLFRSVANSCPALCNPMGLQHARLPCPSPTPSNPCPSSLLCHPTILYSIVLFSSCPQSCPASGSFPMIGLFGSDGQSIGASASALVLPMNIQD